MKRIIYIILVAALLLATLGGLTAFANYEEENSTRGGTYPVTQAEDEGVTATAVGYDDDAGDPFGSEEVTESDAEGKSSSDGAKSTESDARSGEWDATADNGGADVTPTDGGAPSEESKAKNPFAALFDTVKIHATEIFCSLTFVGSILLAFAYKKGLIPLLQGGISAISGTVSKIKESAERGESKTDELSRVVCDRLTDAEACLDGIGQALGELERKLDEVGACERDTKTMKLVMSAQVDMLYSIFMTSSLPQYQKDEVGERIKEMKEALLADDGE